MYVVKKLADAMAKELKGYQVKRLRKQEVEKTAYDPFVIVERTCLSFSGGRTSAYMLWRVLQANGGLPDGFVVCFANTGKEEEKTLEFVRDCGLYWDVPIVWLEYRDDEKGYAVVTFETASRNGEPFEAIIKKRQYLPNPVTRFCTVELKIRTMHKYLADLGWKDGDGWDQMIGIRADEPGRVAKIRARPSPETVQEYMVLPLDTADVGKQDISKFWKAQPFDLGLPNNNGVTMHGNCDLCFLKGPKQILSLIQEKPSRAIWWTKQEAQGLAATPSGARFRNDRPGYAQMLAYAERQTDMFDGMDEGVACFCGD